MTVAPTCTSRARRLRAAQQLAYAALIGALDALLIACVLLDPGPDRPDNFGPQRIEAVAICDDGRTENGEACDDGLLNGTTLRGAPWRCSADCELRRHCGDGHVDPGEECEDRPPGLWATVSLPPTTGDCGLAGERVCRPPGESPECTCVSVPSCPAGVRPSELSGRRVSESPERYEVVGRLPGERDVPGGNYQPPAECARRGKLHGGVTGTELVYSFLAPHAGWFRFSTAPAQGSDRSARDTVLMLLARCGDSQPLACNDDAAARTRHAALDIWLEAGEQVYAVVDGWDAGENGGAVLVRVAAAGLLERGAPCGASPELRCDEADGVFCLAPEEPAAEGATNECLSVTPPELTDVTVVERRFGDAGRCPDANHDSVTWRFDGVSVRPVVEWTVENAVFGDTPVAFALEDGVAVPDERVQVQFEATVCFVRDDSGTSRLPVQPLDGTNPLTFALVDDLGQVGPPYGPREQPCLDYTCPPGARIEPIGLLDVDFDTDFHFFQTAHEWEAHPEGMTLSPVPPEWAGQVREGPGLTSAVAPLLLPPERARSTRTYAIAYNTVVGYLVQQVSYADRSGSDDLQPVAQIQFRRRTLGESNFGVALEPGPRRVNAGPSFDTDRDVQVIVFDSIAPAEPRVCACLVAVGVGGTVDVLRAERTTDASGGALTVRARGIPLYRPDDTPLGPLEPADLTENACGFCPTDP